MSTRATASAASSGSRAGFRGKQAATVGRTQTMIDTQDDITLTVGFSDLVVVDNGKRPIHVAQTVIKCDFSVRNQRSVLDGQTDRTTI